MNILTNWKLILGVAVALFIVLFGAWFLFFRSSAPQPSTQNSGSFGTSANIPSDNSGAEVPNATQPVSTTENTGSLQKIFQISSEPVVGATFIQTFHPTTTLVRYISQNNGHVFDLPVDIAGAIPRVVSNVTIPGGVRAVWVEKNQGAILQYLEGETIKTVYMGFPATGTSTLPTKIQFLPSNIVDLAASPDGKSIVYLLKTSSGVDGYIANPNGNSPKKLFSLPLSQVLISWPSQGTLLAQTKAGVGTPGIAFSVDTKSGVIATLVYAQSLSAIANPNFSTIVYQNISSNGGASYAHTVKQGVDTRLSFTVYPEKCNWSGLNAVLFYCAAPLGQVGANYLDLWHMGAASAADSVLLFNDTTGKAVVAASPGGSDGGVQTDILEMSLSSDEHYLSFISKGNRTLWGVRLTQ